ncbi:hypothetical protein M433DRAFT_156179 [Acidomyces richmondensis BFW]|jgi:hypothetical protein|nr:MAG: hypothetical protein FE78DRAFT_92823 [Acidomyces sp. 'richmondensis']KYG43922.1 hypothetical protein M433DRAFT_156179 [Acidomyces richmondensis BFW]
MQLLTLDDLGRPRLSEDLHDKIPFYSMLSYTCAADHEEVALENTRDSLYSNQDCQL